MLTDRQKLTIEHLKGIGLNQPLEIIDFCVRKLSKPAKRTFQKRSKSLVRKHSREYYQGIINYYAQGNT